MLSCIQLPDCSADLCVQALRREADGKALVLLDEVGTGTDPAEGAALGIALLRALVAGGPRGAAFTMATPHPRCGGPHAMKEIVSPQWWRVAVAAALMIALLVTVASRGPLGAVSKMATTHHRCCRPSPLGE